MNIYKIEKILIVRTDRIGDVVLSTPTLTAVRRAFPSAHIAMMVSPLTKDLVIGNPYLNEVIVLDKKSGFLKALDFIAKLRKKKFDLAFILHSTKRVNIISVLAGIPRRVGYARGKMDFLLTHKLEYKKRLGEKHESLYSLDLLGLIGIEAQPTLPIVPVKKEDEERIDGLLLESGLKEGEKFIVVHPGASCISKRWPVKFFADLIDRLIQGLGTKIVLISSPEQIEIGRAVESFIKNRVIFLCGKTSLGEVAALFKRASLFISNDSGPVHIASAVRCPVISIFGRNEKGLSPTRWRPLGDKATFIHKDVGCKVCLAHSCKKDFLCLHSISVDEALEKARALL